MVDSRNECWHYGCEICGAGQPILDDLPIYKIGEQFVCADCYQKQDVILDKSDN